MSEEDVFEINDFSTSSDWERFIADLEEILTQWNLGGANDDLSLEEDDAKSDKIGAKQQGASTTTASSKLFSDPSLWTQQQDQLKFGKVAFTLTLYTFQNAKPEEKLESTSTERPPSSKSMRPLNRAWREMNSIDHDWPASGHPLVRYYGFSQFIVLCPLKLETIDTEDRIRHLLGSSAIALNNINCEVPFFCQICQPSRRLFSGVLNINNGYRTYFDMIQFSDVPPSFQYLSDLMVLFKKKLYPIFSYSSVHREKTSPANSPIEQSKIRMSIRFTYLLSAWPPQYLQFNGNAPNHPALEQFVYFRADFKPFELLFRPISFQLVANQYADPLKQLQLATTWPSVSEELITDNEFHSDLQPRSAPKWSLRALFLDPKSQKSSIVLCHTTEWLYAFINLRYKYKSALLQACGQQIESSDPSDVDVRSALDRLASPSNQISNQLFNVQKNVFGQLEKNFFASDGAKLSNADDSVKFLFEQTAFEGFEDDSENPNCAQLKSSPVGSLSWRISLLLANSFTEQKNISTVSAIWSAFVERLRSHWKNCQLLPFIDAQQTESIDYGNCLFHQKLQMLNCCIQQKIKREQKSTTSLKLDDKLSEKDGNEDDEDEFFDCPEDEPESTTDADKPEGQLEVFTDSSKNVVYLLEKPNRPIYIPVTQDPAPMTEDHHYRQMQTLAAMSNNPEDVKLKIRLQSSGLLSDMEAFKAANPGATFEDFIRWHSPRDWIELDTEDHEKTSKGSNKKAVPRFGLSRRMRESTMWGEIWELARQVPISRQKRLFDYTKEAEGILHWLQNVTVNQLIELVGPILAKATLIQILQFRQEILDFVSNNISEPKATTVELLPFDFNSFEVQFNRGDYDGLCLELSTVEFEVVKFYSLLKKVIFAYESDVKKPFKDLYTSAQKTTAAKQADSRTASNRGTTLKSATKLGSAILGTFQKDDLIKFVTRLLLEPDVEFSSSNCISSLVVRMFSDSSRFQYESSTSVGDRVGLNSEEPDHHSLSDESEEVTTQKKRLVFSVPQLPAPTGKEFIFRTQTVARPAPYSRPSSQRLYCLISPKKDFRIATAFTEDTAYF